MNPTLIAGIASLVANLVLLGLWQGAREDLVTEIERCNTDKITAIATAERLTREVIEQAYEARLQRIEALADNDRRARQIAETAQVEAEAARAGIELALSSARQRERGSNEISCLDMPVDAGVVECLRANSDCREAGPD